MSSSKPKVRNFLSPQSGHIRGLSSNVDEGSWVNYIRRTLEEKLDQETETPISIFSVPKALMLSYPNSYTPQQVSLGPYHCFRPEIPDMARYKVSAAKRGQRELSNKNFQQIVDEFANLELKIRTCYHKHLSFNGETLAWMMAVDTAFLFEFLQVWAIGAGKAPTDINLSRKKYLENLAAHKAVNNAIFRDIILVENQIPLFVFREFLKFQFPSLELADEWLLSTLIDLSKELSPFKMVEEYPQFPVKEAAHILDFAYHVIVPNWKEISNAHHVIEVEKDSESTKDAGSSYIRKFLDKVRKILSILGRGIKIIVFSKPMKMLGKFPATIISNVPVLNKLKEPLENIFSFLHNGEEKKDDEDSSSKDDIEKPPLIEEIIIPSVIDLFEVGVHFVPTNEGIQSIRFDKETVTLYLPAISVDLNSETVLRNLVAYEACKPSGPLILTRYTELMNGIIDTEEDAKFLRQRGIIINRLKSDKEVADLWNGMSNSIRLTKVPFIDDVIGDVNKYYEGRWKIKFRKFIKKYIYSSWMILTFLATILLLLLMGLQAFCQIYSCGRIFHIKGLEPAGTD